MHTTIHHGAIVHAAFDTHKELILTLCRPAEFYECASTRLRNRAFSFEQLVDYYMHDDATLDYYWSGFNIPSASLERFFTMFDLTPREQQLRQITHPLSARPYYLIATRTHDRATLRHELAHAHFSLNPTYRKHATALVRTLPPRIHHAITRELKAWGYASSVMTDEVNAYMATSGVRWLQSQFSRQITATRVAPFVTLFKSISNIDTSYV
jgi:hypothetical protein